MTAAEWSALTPGQAAKRISAASVAEKRAAKAWDRSGDTADETAWQRAFAYWENLTVLARCGYRARGPHVTENS